MAWLDCRPDGGRVAADAYRDAAPQSIPLSAGRVAAALDSAAAARVTRRAKLRTARSQSAMRGAAGRTDACGIGIATRLAREFLFTGNNSLGARPGDRRSVSILAECPTGRHRFASAFRGVGALISSRRGARGIGGRR